MGSHRVGTAEWYYMQTTPVNPMVEFGRNLYQSLVPSGIRSRIHHSALFKGLRESVGSDEEMPYILLQEEHIANLKVVLNRNALLRQLPPNGIVAEIGVASGDFSRRILTHARPGTLHLIDVWDSDRYHSGLEKVVRDKLDAELNSGQVQINRGYSTSVLPTFDDAYFDWVYIDTDHTYETTRQELLLCAQKVKLGGIIAGHDYITGDWKMRNRYGVVEAVNEFCVKHDWEVVYMTNETHRHLSFAIRQIGFQNDADS